DLGAALPERLRLRAGDRGGELDGGHEGASLSSMSDPRASLGSSKGGQMAYQYWGHDGVTTAVIDCITRDGIHQTSIEVVARELQRSRSALYQRYGNWRGL